ncbi:MAG: adenylosuccinate lyase [Haloferacaceae archaeon]
MFHVDGRLFKNLFGTPEMRAVFEEERFVERFLEVEAALARAQAEVGMIPGDAAEEITACASLEYLDMDQVEANVEEMHLFTISIIDAWKDGVGDAGEYIHWGATSQDISDTATLLQVREGLDIVRRDLEAIRDALAELATEHAETPMMGRTHHVQAIPMTFGLKAATWLDEVDRHLDRLDDLEDRLFDLQFFAAVGTLSSIGEEGFAVQEALAEELDLSVPDVAWYAARDRYGELVTTLAMVDATLGKIASQVLLYNREEIDELNEPIPEGEVGSSTMPHKRNPVKSEESWMLSRLVRSHAGTMLESMGGFDERDASTWFAELAIVPETFLYTSRILQYVHETLAGLVVNEDAMRENLHIHGSLVCSEAVMMALAEEVGRQTAHEILYDTVEEALSSERSFADCVRDDEQVNRVLSEERIEELTDPVNYTGPAARLVERAVERD